MSFAKSLIGDGRGGLFSSCLIVGDERVRGPTWRRIPISQFVRWHRDYLTTLHTRGLSNLRDQNVLLFTFLCRPTPDHNPSHFWSINKVCLAVVFYLGTLLIKRKEVFRKTNRTFHSTRNARLPTQVSEVNRLLQPHSGLLLPYKPYRDHRSRSQDGVYKKTLSRG